MAQPRPAGEEPGGPDGERDRAPDRGDRPERLAYWVILAGLAAGVLWISSGERSVKSGTLELAGVLLLAAITRMVLPERRTGMLGARRRPADVLALLALGVGLLVAGLALPASP
jgi:hypothetical protein